MALIRRWFYLTEDRPDKHRIFGTGESVAFVSRGYICIAPNVRGSTGYGMEFQKANYQDLGGGDLQDEVYAAKFLEATGYVNPKKIGITGGSYGGFMTLMAIGKTPDIWAARGRTLRHHRLVHDAEARRSGAAGI